MRIVLVLEGVSHQIPTIAVNRRFENNSQSDTAISCRFKDNALHIRRKDKIVSIDWVIPFLQIRGMSKEAKAITDRLEPQKSLVTQGLIEENYATSSIMLRGQDSNLEPTP